MLTPLVLRFLLPSDLRKKSIANKTLRMPASQAICVLHFTTHYSVCLETGAPSFENFKLKLF